MERALSRRDGDAMYCGEVETGQNDDQRGSPTMSTFYMVMTLPRLSKVAAATLTVLYEVTAVPSSDELLCQCVASCGSATLWANAGGVSGQVVFAFQALGKVALEMQAAVGAGLGLGFAGEVEGALFAIVPIGEELGAARAAASLKWKRRTRVYALDRKIGAGYLPDDVDDRSQQVPKGDSDSAVCG